jgi:hypothetical protein
VRTLVVDLLGGLGDLVMVLPSVHALRDADPDGELVVLTHAPGAVLLDRDPAVSAVRTAEPHAERAAVEAALAELAADLAAAGDPDSLDVRRAKALGLLARREEIDTAADDSGHRSEGAGGRSRRRQVVLHVHLAQAALRGTGDGFATLTTPTGRPYGPVTVEQVQHWCSGEAVVTVKPVLDLAEQISCTGYVPSPRLRAQVTALNPTCVFPFCTRPSADLDLDHITEHDHGGPTSTHNLAPLCRHHHRVKTFTTWTYIPLGPDRYLWTSPHGYHFLTGPDGTRDLTRHLPDTG